MKNGFALLIVLILTVSSLIMVKPAFAQSIPTPSVPEFTVKYVDASYDVPPTYQTDPYTGKTVITQDGYYIQNRSLDVIITNLPFFNFKDSNGNLIQLFYEVRWKGHFANDWAVISNDGLYGVASNFVLQSSGGQETLVYPNATFTILDCGLGGNNGTYPYDSYLGTISPGGQVDFQVQEYVGYYTTITGTPDPLFHEPTVTYVFNGNGSGWSNTQTIMIPTNGSPSATSVPAVPEFSSTTIFFLLTVMVSTSLLTYHKKHKH